MRTAQPRRRKPKTPRVIGLIGPKGGGKHTVAQLLVESSRRPCAWLPELTREAAAARPDVEVWFVKLNTPEDVTTALIEGLIDSSNDGCVVLVLPDGLQCEWAVAPREAYERVIRLHMMPFRTVHNRAGDPTAAVIGLAQAARLTS